MNVKKTKSSKKIIQKITMSMTLMAVAKEISACWQSLSKEDPINVTAGCMEEIEEEHEAKKLGSHNIPLKAFYNARSTMQAVKKDISGALSDHQSQIN